MFCPQCGQEQASAQVRFCSRCGFQLRAVTELLSTGGVPAPAQAAQGAGAGPSPRRQGLRQGALLMLIGMIVTPLLAVLLGPPRGPFGMPHTLIPLSAIIFFWGGILRMLYALFFQEGPIRKPKLDDAFAALAPSQQQSGNVSAGGYAGREAAYLPPAREGVPARTFLTRDGRTGEVVAPPGSVTENTTRLLRDTPDEETR